MERRKEVIEVEAISGNLDQVTGFVEEQVLQMGCPPKLAMQIILAVEEAFVNVVDYAYAPEIGMCRIAVETAQLDEGRGDAVITFIDSGKARYYVICRRTADRRSWNLYGERNHGFCGL